MLMPASSLSSSPDKWNCVPVPDDPKFSFPGCDLAGATSSLMDCAGTRPVVDHHLLSEKLGGFLRHNTGEDVRLAADRERDDQAHCTIRKVVGSLRNVKQACSENRGTESGA